MADNDYIFGGNDTPTVTEDDRMRDRIIEIDVEIDSLLDQANSIYDQINNIQSEKDEIYARLRS